MSCIRLSKIKTLILFVLSVVLFLAATLFFQIHQFLHTPPQTPGKDVVIHIRKGESFARVAAQLQAQGVISDQLKFKILGRFSKQVASIQAGEFRVNTGWLPRHVLKTLIRGQSVLYPVTIPEGLTWWQTAERIEQAGLGTKESFKTAVFDPAFLTLWNVAGPSVEGYLFPDTYLLPHSATNDAGPVALAMLRTFYTKTTGLFPPSTSPQSMQRILTLASLVEKETGQESERTRIAGVYANRLQRGMRLQCDPTIIYGIGPDFNGNLTRKDIRNKLNPYNTYAHKGLPPGPICSPGRASIMAALHPETHTFLYFVSKGDGSHVFSKTLSEHNRFVRRYQLHQ